MLYVHAKWGTDWWILGVKREKLSSSPTVASAKSQHCPTVGLCSLNTFMLQVYNDCIGRWRWRRERKMAKAIVLALSALLAATSISGELHEIYLLSWQQWTIPVSVFKHWKAGSMPQVSVGATKRKSSDLFLSRFFSLHWRICRKMYQVTFQIQLLVSEITTHETKQKYGSLKLTYTIYFHTLK